MEILDGMITVFQSSHILWSNDPSPYGRFDVFGECDPQDQVELADAWGGFMGGTIEFWGGPVTGMVGMYVGQWGFSKAVRAQIKKNGGRCI